jgi:hypothetical protein
MRKKRKKTLTNRKNEEFEKEIRIPKQRWQE